MNVTLNIVSVDARAERAGMGARHGEAEAESGDFRALFDEVGRAPADEHGLQSDPRSAQKPGDGERMALDAPAEAVPDEPDSDASDNSVAPRLPAEAGDARYRRAVATAASAGRQQVPLGDLASDGKVAEENPGAAEEETAVPAERPAGADAMAPPQAAMHGADDPVPRRQSDQTNRRKDGKTPPTDTGGATVPDAAAVAVPADVLLPGAVRAPEPQVPAKDAGTDAMRSGDAPLADRKSDGRASPSDSDVTESAGAAFATQWVASGNADQPLRQAAAGRTDQADDDADMAGRLPSDGIREPATIGANRVSRTALPQGDTAPADKAGQGGKTGSDVPAEPLSGPTAAKAEAGSGQIRLWADGETAAAFAPRADDNRPTREHSLADTPQAAARRTPSSGDGDAPIDARVTTYERHSAPVSTLVGRSPTSRRSDAPIEGRAASGKGHQTVPAPAGGGQIAAAVDDRLGKDATPTAASAAQAGTGSAERPQAARRDQGWQPLFFPDRGGSSASPKVPSDQSIPVKADRVAATNVVTRSEPDEAGGRETSKTNPAVALASAHAEEKPHAATAQSNPASTPSASTSTASLASASPLAIGVASGIANALASARTTSAAPSAPVPLDPTTEVGAAEPVKTIALALDMREHGQVDLRISLRGNAVSVQVRTERAETADALARDDTSLREALHRAGYEAQQVQIDRRDGAAARAGDAAPSGQPAGGTGAGGLSGQTAGDQRAATPDQRPSARRDETAFSLHDQDTHDAPRQDRYRGPDRLYV